MTNETNLITFTELLSSHTMQILGHNNELKGKMNFKNMCTFFKYLTDGINKKCTKTEQNVQQLRKIFFVVIMMHHGL